MLLPFLNDIAPYWYELGAALLNEEEESQLEVIEANHKNDISKCCLAMFQYWWRSHPEATWNILLIKLRSSGVNLATVASDIEKNFTGKHDVNLYYLHYLISIFNLPS